MSPPLAVSVLAVQDPGELAAGLWLGALALLVAGVGALGLWAVVKRLDKLIALEKRLDVLDDVRSALSGIAKERGDLDLRRIEHVLIELRDGQRRLEDSILRATQAALRPAPVGEPSAPHPHDSLAARIIARVVAQGFERVLLVPSHEELERLTAAGGAQEVLVEARRNGVLCKGRVLLRDGAVTDVELSPAYTLFP